jgi:mannose-6-phosphate isomerase-like protein (cupin superfamily)
MTNESSAGKNRTLVLVLLGFMIGTSMAQAADVTVIMSQDLADIPGLEVLMTTVEKAPGGWDPKNIQDSLFTQLTHRANAHGFIYVLDGSLVMQVGGKEVTLTPGQAWYERPRDVHVIGRNASSTKSVKLLVFLLKDKGAPVLEPVK